MSLIPLKWLVALVLASYLFYLLSRLGKRQKNLPSGPPTIPILGNLHQIPKKDMHLQFHEWAKQYGPVYSLILGTKTLIVLSSDRAVKDLLDKRGDIYSSRPEQYVANIVTGGFHPLLQGYGETWRAARKILHRAINITVADRYIPYQELESKALLVGLLETPDNFIGHLRRFAGSLTTQMLYGFRTKSFSDPKLHHLFEGIEEFVQVMGNPAASLLDLYPLLRHLPSRILPMKRHAEQLHHREVNLFVGQYLEAKKKFRNGTLSPCICADIAQAQEEQGFSDAIAGYMAGSILEAGADTTAAVLAGFILAMVSFPEVFKQAQAEVDRVCGDRIPNLDDFPNLQIIRGCMKETMRWFPTGIMGVPHCVTRDDEYLGYRIPKGATVILNVWGISNDRERHPNPRKFDPVRWVNDMQTSAEAANNPDASQRDHFIFGAGRRICQGMHIADRTLFLGMSRVLWAFDISKPADEDLPEINKFTSGSFVWPLPFKAVITPRSAFKEMKVRQEWADMAQVLDEQSEWKTVPGASK